MKRRLLALVCLCVAAASTAIAADTPVRDAAAAIKKGQFVCKLEPTTSSSGQWQATLIKNPGFGDEWHVWFGTLPEPVCGFAGAIVKVDGSYTSCAVSACKAI